MDSGPRDGQAWVKQCTLNVSLGRWRGGGEKGS